MAANPLNPPLRAVYLEPRVRKFLDLNDNIPLSQINATTSDLRCIIRAFDPDVKIPLFARKRDLIEIFELVVQPCFNNFEEFDGGTGTMYFRPVNLCQHYLSLT